MRNLIEIHQCHHDQVTYNTAPPQEDVHGEEVIKSIQTIADVEEESEEDRDANQGTRKQTEYESSSVFDR